MKIRLKKEEGGGGTHLKQNVDTLKNVKAAEVG